MFYKNKSANFVLNEFHIDVIFIYLSIDEERKIHKCVYNQNTVGYQYKSSGRQ